MTSPDSDTDLQSVEKRRLRALVDGDTQAARELHADDFQLITPGGATLSKDAYLSGIASGELNYVVFEPLSAISVRDYGDAVAMRFRVRIEIEYSGQSDADDFWYTDIYERRAEGWQVVWSQATRIRR
jgi:hypothetical protein